MAEPTVRINLEKVSALFVEDKGQGINLLTQIFAGFGVRSPHRASDARSAMNMVRTRELDLIVVDAALPGGKDGYEFVRELRRCKVEPVCFVPVILVEGHTRIDKVGYARDCGASFVIAKPLSSRVLLERVLWVARETRPFIDAGVYVGPDRRFQNLGPPPGVEGRRGSDTDPTPAWADTPQDAAKSAA